MIALDAAVLIALLDAGDAQHARSHRFFVERLGEDMVISPINLAEVLVRAAAEAQEDQMLADIRALGVRPLPLPDDAAPRLARLRARSGVRMPDCCALLAADQAGAELATFDERLRAAATALGIGLAG